MSTSGFLALGLCALIGFAAPAADAAQPQDTGATPILRVETGMHGAVINRIALAGEGRVLVTVSDDKTTRLWGLSDGAAQAVWRTPIGEGDSGALYAVAAAGELVVVGGRTEAAGGKGFALYVFDRRSGQMRGNIGGFAEPISALAFSADGTRLAVGEEGRGGLTLIDFAGHKIVAQDHGYAGTVAWIAFAPDGRLASSAADGRIRLYDAALKTIAATSLDAHAAERPWGLAFSPDGRRLAVGSLGGAKIRLFSGDHLRFEKTLDGAAGTSGALSVVAWGADGTSLAASGSYKNGAARRAIRFWHEAGGAFAPAADVAVADDTVTDLALLADGRAVYASAEPSLGVVGADGAQGFRHGSDHSDFRDAWQDAFRVSNDGAIVDFPSRQGGKGRFRFDLLDGSLTADPAPRTDLKLPVAEGAGLKLADWRNGTAPRLNGRPIALDASEHVRSVAVLPDDDAVAMGTDFYLRLERAGGEAWRQVVPAPVWAVDASGDGRMIVAALGDGTIRWYQAANGQEVMSLFVDREDRRWVVWVPEGFFDHSRQSGGASGETLVGYQIKKGPGKAADFVAIGQLYNSFYRRDLVLAKFRGGALGERSVAEQLARVGDGATAARSGLPPRAELVEACLRPPGAGDCPPGAAMRPTAPGDRRFALVGAGTELLARYRIVDRGGGLGRVIVRRNGAVIDGAPVVEGADAHQRSEAVAIPLDPARDEIRLSTESANAAIQSGTADDVVLTVTPASSPPPSRPATSGPAAPGPAVPQDGGAAAKLFVLAVGVSRYQQPEFRLANAANDAAAVADLLRKPSPPVYEEADATALLDGAATAVNIASALARVAAAARPQDVVVIFFSGHGEAVDGKYFFAPVDFATRHPQELAEAKGADDARQAAIIDQLFREDGFGEAQLLPLLEKIQGNLLLVLDTCFSATLATGDAVGEKARNETVARSVGHETGRFILAGARSLALDSGGAGDASAATHGLFTANLLKGLRGEGDLQHVGRVNVAELLMFTKARVREESRKLNLDQEPSYYFSGSNFFDVRADDGAP